MPLHSAVLLFFGDFFFCLYFVPAQAQLRRFHCSRRCGAGAGAGAAAPVAAAGAGAAPVAAGASLAVVRTRWLR